MKTMSDKNKRRPRQLSNEDVSLIDLIDRANLPPRYYEFTAIPEFSSIKQEHIDKDRELGLSTGQYNRVEYLSAVQKDWEAKGRTFVEKILNDRPKGEFKTLLRRTYKKKGIDAFLKLYDEIGAIKRLLDLETDVNEKMPPWFEERIGREIQINAHIFASRVNGKFTYKAPDYLDRLKGTRVDMLRRCKHCGKIFLAPRKDSQFCRPTNNRPSSCRNSFNLQKFRSQEKKNKYKSSRVRAENKRSEK